MGCNKPYDFRATALFALDGDFVMRRGHDAASRGDANRSRDIIDDGIPLGAGLRGFAVTLIQAVTNLAALRCKCNLAAGSYPLRRLNGSAGRNRHQQGGTEKSQQILPWWCRDTR
jgi:hypothetical protein